MLDLQTSFPANSTKSLAETIRPYQVLYLLKWENLLNKKQRDGLIQFLVQIYFTAKSTEALLDFATQQSALRDDENLSLFIDWAKTHAQEEKDHHKWYLDDLLAIGCRRAELENQIANDIVLELLGMQFALMATVHPVAVLGYFFSLECYNNKPEAIYELARRYSIPHEGIRTLLYHTEVDQEHRKPILELIDFYSPNHFLYQTIQKAAIATLLGWTKFFTKLAQDNN